MKSKSDRHSSGHLTGWHQKLSIVKLLKMLLITGKQIYGLLVCSIDFFSVIILCRLCGSVVDFNVHIV